MTKPIRAGYPPNMYCRSLVLHNAHKRTQSCFNRPHTPKSPNRNKQKKVHKKAFTVCFSAVCKNKDKLVCGWLPVHSALFVQKQGECVNVVCEHDHLERVSLQKYQSFHFNCNKISEQLLVWRVMTSSCLCFARCNGYHVKCLVCDTFPTA